MLLIRNVLVHVAAAAVAFLASQPAAKATFIMSPMPASLSGGAPYQPASPAGKPALGQQEAHGSELIDAFLRTEMLGPVPLSLPPGMDRAGLGTDKKTVLPEPATIAMLGVGLLSLAFLRRAAA